ncbi:MAG: NAD(P)/FAD-dependent oxidoreductase [Nitrososphaerales archaeon]|nr:NAD(P)/FAD-dependent oxidoreductase [Nitrososphaerales archaeon]
MNRNDFTRVSLSAPTTESGHASTPAVGAQAVITVRAVPTRVVRVAVVGAGTAGKAAALAAAGRGARVTLFDAGQRLPVPKSSWPSILSGDERQPQRADDGDLTREGVEISLGSSVTKASDDLTLTVGGRNPGFDGVVLSTGSAFVPERLEGMRKRGVHVLDSLASFRDLRERMRDYGKSAVCGSGPVAVEVAEKLRSRGVAVILLSPGGALPMLNEGPRRVVLEALSSWGIEVCAAKPDRVVGVEAVEAVMASGEVYPCDSCVILPRTIPLVPEARAMLGRSGGLVVDESMQSSVPRLYGAGDCTEIHAGSTTLSVMFESSATVMGSVAGANAAGEKVSAKVVGSYFKELLGVGIASSGFSLAEAVGLGLDVAEAKSGKGESACSLVFRRGDNAIVGAQLAGKGIMRYAESLALIVASGLTLRQLAYQETAVSSDISPIAEAAREGVWKI